MSDYQTELDTILNDYEPFGSRKHLEKAIKHKNGGNQGSTDPSNMKKKLKKVILAIQNLDRTHSTRNQLFSKNMPKSNLCSAIRYDTDVTNTVLAGMTGPSIDVAVSKSPLDKYVNQPKLVQDVLDRVNKQKELKKLKELQELTSIPDVIEPKSKSKSKPKTKPIAQVEAAIEGKQTEHTLSIEFDLVEGREEIKAGEASPPGRQYDITTLALPPFSNTTISEAPLQSIMESIEEYQPEQKEPGEEQQSIVDPMSQFLETCFPQDSQAIQAIFTREQITYDLLFDLDHTILKELGFVTGQRLKFMKQVKLLQQQQ